MKRLLILICLAIIALPLSAQDNGRTLKPNYRKIARVVRQPGGTYNIDSLYRHFSLRDTSMSIDHFRCLYYGGTPSMLTAAHVTLRGVGSRFGLTSRQAGEAWWRYQMLLSAIWSSGDGSKRKPLHVTGHDDAQRVADDFGAPLWFKMRGKCKFSVAPLP